jgi:hypothetical protein
MSAVVMAASWAVVRLDTAVVVVVVAVCDVVVAAGVEAVSPAPGVLSRTLT